MHTRAVYLLLLVMLLMSLRAGAHASEPSCATPASINDGWKSVDMASADFDAPRLCGSLERATNGEFNLHGIVIERHGRLVAERYRNGPDKGVYSLFSRETQFGPTVAHDARSASKSVLSLLLGIAITQGKIASVAVPVADFYPEFPELATPGHKAITLQHLLTMTSGLEWSESGGIPNDETSLFWKSSPYAYLFARTQVAPPGAKFNYNSGGTAVLADIVVRASRMPLRDFARSHLFEPLGIVDWEWVGDVHGRPMVFNGLRMRPRDMAKIGRMVADRGQWQGLQVVSAAWIDESMRSRAATEFDGLQYGYQWWLGSVDWHGKKVRWSAGFGNGAQRIFVVPELDMTVAITAGAYENMQAARYVNKLLQEIVDSVRK